MGDTAVEVPPVAREQVSSPESRLLGIAMRLDELSTELGMPELYEMSEEIGQIACPDPFVVSEGGLVASAAASTALSANTISGSVLVNPSVNLYSTAVTPSNSLYTATGTTP